MQLTEFELEIFGVGLGVGLILAAGVGLNAMRLRWGLRREIENLKKSLYVNMSVQSEGTEKLQKSLDKIKRKNEKLRTTISTLSNKPGRAELQTLHTWERAIELLTLRSPTFAAAWQLAVDEAKTEMAETRTGVKALMRKAFSSSSIEGDDKDDNKKLEAG
ncbi:MAG: hypothetical protein HC795_08795 [Coleofasciculaceae cyanobacterium RL_1_1]|nr:hypothetical protein [Coleofasciculaceae cyanobacterium RL_1_1]